MSRRFYLIAAVSIVSLIAITIRNTSFAQNETQRKQSDVVDASEHTASIGRYQLAAFGEGGSQGYYILDTSTGELWGNYGDNKPSRISGPIAE